MFHDGVGNLVGFQGFQDGLGRVALREEASVVGVLKGHGADCLEGLDRGHGGVGSAMRVKIG